MVSIHRYQSITELTNIMPPVARLVHQCLSIYFFYCTAYSEHSIYSLPSHTADLHMELYGVSERTVFYVPTNTV